MEQETIMDTKKKVSFDNLQIAFAGYTNEKLQFSYRIFNLINHPLLVKISSALTLIGLKLRLPIQWMIKATIFKQFCGGENIEECKPTVLHLGDYGIKSILDFSAEGKQREKDFERTKEEMLKIIDTAAASSNIPYTSIKLTSIIRFALMEKITARNGLTKEEKQEWEKAKERLDTICQAAHNKNISLYTDAEETWIQQAIDDITEDMMKKYNSEKAVVSTTLQMYRWDRIEYLKKIIENGGKANYIVGVKLVRGAYWEKENARAASMGYPSPLHQLKEDTDRDYNKALDICMENIDRVVLCNGTHNEESCMHLVNLLDKLHLAHNHENVWFSQLYGMSDHISYNLGDAGYNVTKYLPYGPIPSVTPYLLRRAEENTAIKGQMGRELKLIINEMKRRGNFTNKNS